MSGLQARKGRGKAHRLVWESEEEQQEEQQNNTEQQEDNTLGLRLGGRKVTKHS